MVNKHSQKLKERLPQEAHERHQNLSEENNKRQKTPKKDLFFFVIDP